MMKALFATLCVTALATTPPALARTSPSSCPAQAKSIKAGQADARALRDERDSLLAEVEAAGDEWDAAEQTRLFGESEAGKAEAAKTNYKSMKAELMSLERELQAQVSELNSAVRKYNRRCATD